MHGSSERILTTHVGSLIRTRDIIEGMKARTLGQPYNDEKFAADIDRGIQEVVRKQIDIGIDIPNDGEYRRRGYTTYIHERLNGLERRTLDEGERNPLDRAGHQWEEKAFPGFFEQYDRVYRFMWMLPEVDMSGMENIRGKSELFRLRAPISYKGNAAVQQDISSLRSALNGAPVADAFITAVTPATVRRDQDILKFYPSHQEYLYAIAEALNQDYRAITDAGFILQLDIPQFQQVGGYGASQDPSKVTDESIDKAMDLGVELVNHALRGIPEDRVRTHYCGGSGNRPHVQNVPLRKIMSKMIKINAQTYGFEAANPRHEHEWQLWQDVKLPDGKMIMPGLISQSTNVVEHPELIAWRIKNFASVVGKENIIAGADCGFSQDWDLIRVHPTVQWAKLQALVDGAAIASKQLWGRVELTTSGRTA